MSTKQIPVLKIKQNSYDLFLTKLRADEIKDFTTVLPYKSELSFNDEDQGYQRSAEPSRYKNFANYLIKAVRPLCPTAILLSARSIDLKYDEKLEVIELDTKEKLHIVDGQHRAEGYRFVVFEKSQQQLSSFEVPVIIVANIDKVTEMRQFEVINRTQKGVSRALVNTILTQYSEKVGESKLEDSERPKVVATRVVEALNKRPNSPWHNLIIMPNEKAPTKKEILENQELANIKVVRATSFMTSIKPIYDYLEQHEFLRGDLKEHANAVTNILIEFWSAVKSKLPLTFASPSEYVIQKTPGLFSLHTICKRLMIRMHRDNRAWVEVEFENLLSDDVEAFSDCDFWDRYEGEAAKYGSMKGFSELAGMIDMQLRSAGKAA